MKQYLRRAVTIFFLLTMALLIFFFLFRSKYYAVITNLAQTQVTNATSDLINDAVAKQIADGRLPTTESSTLKKT